MAKQTKLPMLQYNMENEKINIIIFLFANLKIQQYDAIIVQRLWRNIYAAI